MDKDKHCRNITCWWAIFSPIIMIVLLWLAACASSGEVSSAVGNLEILDEVSETSIATHTQVEVVNVEPTPTATAHIFSEATPHPTKPVEPPVDPIEPEMCSPLAIHTIEELAEIVSAEYDPPPPGKEARHQGVDFSYYRRGDRTSILGVDVISVFPGTVACAIEERFPYGNMVIVETSQGALPGELVASLGMEQRESLYLLYAHLDGAPVVKPGETVEACQSLGVVGKSGNAGVPHLHLEARVGPAGVKFESMAYYSTGTTEEERRNYEMWRTSGVFRHVDPMGLFAVSD
jgi:murein DD-endopeptidase MepM/ murein hydrolase activator NlpD